MEHCRNAACNPAAKSLIAATDAGHNFLTTSYVRFEICCRLGQLAKFRVQIPSTAMPTKGRTSPSGFFPISMIDSNRAESG
jgi:hypothetical protein